MIAQAPTWNLFYKNLGSNLEIILKMQQIMDFNQNQLTESVWISNFGKKSKFSNLSSEWVWETSIVT
jgi:hypothetical protein